MSTNFNFLSLPGELRNRIYELLVLHQEPINISEYLSLPGELRNRIYKLTPGLLRTSKTVHREASSLLYSQNRFDFTEVSLKMAASFLEKIGRINANSIRHII